MKKVLFLIVIIYGINTNCICQQVVPSTTRFIDDGGKMEIGYDLKPVAGVISYDVQLKITSRNRTITASELSGDFGTNISPGEGKAIIWDALVDGYPLESSYEATILVVYHKKPCNPINPLPAYIGLGATTIAGAGLVLAGLKSKSDSDELYDIYKNNLYSLEKEVYRDLSREELYKKANNKHKKSQWLTWGGASVIAIGGTAIIFKLIKIKKHNDKCSDSLGDKWKVEPFLISGQGNVTGVSLTYSF